MRSTRSDIEIKNGTEYSRPLFDIIIFYYDVYETWCVFGEIDFLGDRLPGEIQRPINGERRRHIQLRPCLC